MEKYMEMPAENEGGETESFEISISKNEYSLDLSTENGKEEEHCDVDKMRALLKLTEAVKESLPPAEEGCVRLWRSDMPSQTDENIFNKSLDKAAIPAWINYEGTLYYIDVPEQYLEDRSECALPLDMAQKAIAVDVLAILTELNDRIEDAQ